jgi:DNA repair photolyase
MDFDWSNPYMGARTAARTATWLVRAGADRPADDRYGSSIRVKVNIVEVLRQELARSSWLREEVVIGAATDPYQPAEGRYRLTRGCIEAFAERRNPFGIITRGPLIVRDIDVLQEASKRADVTVSVSIPTLDLDVWRDEPGMAAARAHETVRRLADAGIDARAWRGFPASPTAPIADAVVRGARCRGDTAVSIVLHLPAGNAQHFLHSLERHARVLPRYERVRRFRRILVLRATRPITSQVAKLRAGTAPAPARARCRHARAYPQSIWRSERRERALSRPLLVPGCTPAHRHRGERVPFRARERDAPVHLASASSHLPRLASGRPRAAALRGEPRWSLGCARVARSARAATELAAQTEAIATSTRARRRRMVTDRCRG